MATDAPPQAEDAPAEPSAPAASEPAKAKQPVAAKEPKAAKDDKKAKKDKKDKDTKDADGEDAADGPSVAAHPRARRAVARAKGWAGLIGFFLGGYLSLPTNTLAAAGLRALVAGVICYVAVWAGAVFVWRRLVILELKNREQQLHANAAPPPRELPAPKGERVPA
jgi:hypothetical protein